MPAARSIRPAATAPFSSRLPNCVAIELDPAHCPPGALNIDFFSLSRERKVRQHHRQPALRQGARHPAADRAAAGSSLLDGHANLYLHFIEKCVRHLAPLGELIFITPRDFLKATGRGAAQHLALRPGHDHRFRGSRRRQGLRRRPPNCAIWRFVRGDLSHRLRDGRRMALSGGQLMFTRGIYSLPLASVFAVKVGAVSGADEIFSEPSTPTANSSARRRRRPGRRDA
jgi:adenine-specific DNA-methyltransferase